MTVSKYLTCIVLGILFFGCNNTTQVKVQDVELSEIISEQEIPLPIAPSGLKVSAYLIYKDSSISTFDILNDSSVVLWNTIIGAGDALKPSEKTVIRFTGKLDSLNVTIYNGNREVINQMLPNFSGDSEFVINNTGCEVVKIAVTKQGKEIYRNIIPFRCGE